MSDEKQTPDQVVAEMAASALDGQRYRLLQERAVLVEAQARIAEIDEILAAMAPESDRLESRRPPKPREARGALETPVRAT